MKTLLLESDFKALAIALSNWYDEYFQDYNDFDGYQSCVDSMSKSLHSQHKVLDGEKLYECIFDKSAISFVLDHIIDNVFCTDDEVSILRAFTRALLND